MNNLPAKLRRELSEDPYYQKCCITGLTNVKIDWHHNFIYQGRQLQEKWCILPLAEYIHKEIDKYKEKCDWIMLNRTDEGTLKKYSRGRDLLTYRKCLNGKYDN